MIRILLGFHGALLRAALSRLLAAQVDLAVVAELGHGEEVLPAVLRERPHIIVLDHALLGSVDVEALCAQLPDCRVLALLDWRSSGRIGRALARLAPQVGLLSLDSPPHEFVDAVRRLARGEPVLDAGVAMVALHSQDCVLTGRERDVLRLAAIGATAKEIALRLGLSPGTVRNYLSRTLTKLGARTRIEAIRIAQDAGWI